jgi:hypothetical protein
MGAWSRPGSPDRMDRPDSHAYILLCVPCKRRSLSEDGQYLSMSSAASFLRTLGLPPEIAKVSMVRKIGKIRRKNNADEPRGTSELEKPREGSAYSGNRFSGKQALLTFFYPCRWWKGPKILVVHRALSQANGER